MTLRTRNAILLFGAACSIMLFLVFFVCLAYVIHEGFEPTGSRLVEQLAAAWGLRAGDVFWNFLAGGSISIFAAMGIFGLRSLFRRTSSAEIFFFAVFVLTLSLEALRPLIAVLLYRGASLAVAALLTRVIYFGYFVGVFSLFASSLYALELRFQKIGTLLGVVILLSLLFAYALNVDVTSLYPTLVFKLGREEFLRTVLIGFGLLTGLNFVRAALTSKSQDQMMISLSIVLVIGGREGLFATGSSITTGLGFLALGFGTLMFVRKNYSQSLWL